MVFDGKDYVDEVSSLTERKVKFTSSRILTAVKQMFQRLTGSNQFVGNWENAKRRGRLKRKRVSSICHKSILLFSLKYMDLPFFYSVFSP